MDVIALLILTLLWPLALITILFALALPSLIFITRKNMAQGTFIPRKNMAQATFILGCSLVITSNFILTCSLVTWNLAVSAMLAKGWGWEWKMYWPIFAFNSGLTFCIKYAIFQYNPPTHHDQFKLGLLDHLNSHHLITGLLNYVKGLFNYVNIRFRRPKNANVAPSHLKDLSPPDVESPKKFWWSAMWLALIKPENIAYTILNVSMCPLLWTVTFFDIMLTMNTGWQRRVWSSFVTTCCMMAPMIFMVYMDDNSPQPMISHTRRVKGLFDRLNPSLVKRLFNHMINISPRSAEDATVASSHLTGVSPTAIKTPRKFWSALRLRENIAYMIFMVTLSWSVTIIAIVTTNSGWAMAWSSFAVTFGVIFMIYVEGRFDHPSPRLTKNANVMAPSHFTELSPAAVESPNVIPDIYLQKAEAKATKQEEDMLYTVESKQEDETVYTVESKSKPEEEIVYKVESNDKSKCQCNETDLDHGWEIIEEAEINESYIATI